VAVFGVVTAVATVACRAPIPLPAKFLPAAGRVRHPGSAGGLAQDHPIGSALAGQRDARLDQGRAQRAVMVGLPRIRIGVVGAHGLRIARHWHVDDGHIRHQYLESAYATTCPRPRRRLRAVGTAYIDFALTEPGLFRTAFTSHPAISRDTEDDAATDPEDPSDKTAIADPFDVLGQVLDEAQAAGLLDPRRRPGAEIAAWSAVHGLANLLLDGPLPTSPAGIKFSRGQVMDLVERGLLNGTRGATVWP
jgi:hypothetical protein